MLALSVDRATFGSGSQFGLVLGAQRYVEHFPHLRLDQGTVERLHQTALGPETNRADNNVLKPTRREKQWLIAYVQVSGPEPVEVAYDEAVEFYEQADALDSQA